MKNKVAILGAALLLSGCGGYFDQQPTNIRPESEAVATVLAHERTTTIAQSSPLPRSAAGGSHVTETVLPAAERSQSQGVPAKASPALNEETATSPTAVAPSPSRPASPAIAAAAAPDVVTHSAPVSTNHQAISPAIAEPVSTPTVEAAAPVARTPAGPVRATALVEPARTPPAQAAAPVAQIPTGPAPEQSVTPSITSPPSAVEPVPTVAMQSAPETTAVPAAAPPPVAPEAHCESVARQRADDAAAGGLDRETQEIVRKGAYSDCVAWGKAHPPPP